VRLSLRDEQAKEKYLGDDAAWQKSQKILEDLLIKNKIQYKKAAGEAAFYGPKMDIVASDALGREFQISTIQLDFNMPVRFELEYIDEKGEKKTPVMIHRAIVGSPERFMGILIEHYAGVFPLWLSPVQVMIIPVSEKFTEYGNKVLKELKQNDIRAEIDDSDESLGKRIRNAEKQKIPYMLVAGEREAKEKTVAVRVRGQKEQETLKVEQLITQLKKQIEQKA
jgi:threonyl-tRNA synthetase